MSREPVTEAGKRLLLDPRLALRYSHLRDAILAIEAEAASPDTRVPDGAHNHGPDEGPGIGCRERVVGGRFVGACIDRGLARPWPEEGETDTFDTLLTRPIDDGGYGMEEHDSEAWLRAVWQEARALAASPSPESDGLRANEAQARAFHEMTQVGGPWSPCSGQFGIPMECLCYEMATDVMQALSTPSLSTAPGKLDVGRLRQAIYAVSVRHDWEHTTDREDRTEEIAREYAALTEGEPKP